MHLSSRSSNPLRCRHVSSVPAGRVGRPGSSSRKFSLSVSARLTARGISIPAKKITLKKVLGEGSYGTVFEGLLDTPGGDERVVLKRVKARVQGAEEMAQMEHLMNVYASKAAKGSIAEFLGYCEVAAEESNYRLTEGLWLLWRYEGQNTLAYYLRRRDTLRALARDLDVPEDIVVPVAMRQLLLGLSALHSAGLVHRDVKPLNVIASERDARLKLIDLGAAADLRTGTNYSPEESILDPMYCPPEQFVLPTDSPHLAKSAFAMALSPVLWAQHKPDRFDSWSAGIVLLQLCLPPVRSPRGLNLFKTEYERAGYDLQEWRKGCRWISKRDTAVLDEDDGAGWDLAQSLLRPRSIEVDDDGRVSFVSQGGFQRIGAQEALKHRFLRPAALHERNLRRSLGSVSADQTATAEESLEEALSSGSGSRSRAGSGGRRASAAARSNGRGGSGSASSSGASSAAGSRSGSGSSRAGSGWWGLGRKKQQPIEEEEEEEEEVPAAAAAASNGGLFTAATGLWRGMQDRLFDLEARMIKTASETAKQTTKVQKLEAKVAQGKADARQLAQEKQRLGQMQEKLEVLEDEKTKTASRANSLLSFLGLGGSSSSKAASEPTSAAPASSSKQGVVSKPRGSLPQQQQAEKQQPPRSGSKNVLMQTWEALGQQLLQTEGRLKEQESKTQKQRLSVQQLKEKVQAGRATPAELQREQEKLGQMDSQLQGLQSNYTKMRDQAAALLQRMGASGADAAAEGSTKAASGLTGAVYAGIKFSGLAMRIAADVVSSVTDDAGKMLREMEEEANVKRARKAAEAAFLQLLKDNTPPDAASTSPRPASPVSGSARVSVPKVVIDQDSIFVEVEVALQDEPAWQGVASPERRVELFAAYIEALRQVAAQRIAKAEAAVTQLLVKLNVGPESSWDEVAPLLAAAPGCAIVPLDRRAELFDERVQEVVLERACKAAAERADNDFRALLLSQQQEGAISARSTWSAVKAQLWSDIRYQSLPEDRRLQLFNEFMLEFRQQQAVADAAAAAEAAAAASAAAAATTSAPSAPGSSNGTSSPATGSFSTLATEDLDLGVDAAGMAPEDLAKLQLLRWEQQRLRQEYQKMEEQLRKMEQQIRSNTSSPVAGAAPDNEPAGASVAAAAAAAAAAASSNGAAGAAAAVEGEEGPVEPVVESLANGEPMNVVVEGGAGDVSVEVNRDGVVVFKFAGEGQDSRTASPVASGPSSAGDSEP